MMFCFLSLGAKTSACCSQEPCEMCGFLQVPDCWEAAAVLPLYSLQIQGEVLALSLLPFLSSPKRLRSVNSWPAESCMASFCLSQIKWTCPEFTALNQSRSHDGMVVFLPGPVLCSVFCCLLISWLLGKTLLGGWVQVCVTSGWAGVLDSQNSYS